MSWLGLRIPSEIFTPCGKKVGNLYDLVRITRFAGMEPGVESFGENREGIRHTSQGQFADRVDLDDSGASLMQPGRARGKSGDESRSFSTVCNIFGAKRCNSAQPGANQKWANT